LNYFRRSGLIFTGKLEEEKVLLTPPEVLHVFRELDTNSYRERVRVNTELIQLTQGLLFYYGTLSLGEYHDLLHQHMDVPFSMGEVLDVLSEAREFHPTLYFDRQGISDVRVVDSHWVKEEHRIRHDLSFYPFTKAQLLRAGQPDFVDRTPHFRAFVQYLQKSYRLDRLESEFIVEECVEDTLTNCSLQEQMDYLQTTVEIPDIDVLNEIAGYLVELSNNTRQWALKGHTPRELSPRKQEQTQPKVGRNALCPCGSGKKYKKCCGA
ncbi:MAG TPA: SEC-C metal-binding domain-containing protein, partial [Bacilli bacterium]|nr:SEC-C metal-binding domain-containing protein [Bacilli bacterium]